VDGPARPASRLFVTIGASHYPFDRLMTWIDAWLRTSPGRQVRCVVQHGTSRAPGIAECHQYLGYEEVESTLRDTDVVVCHGGPGTIMLAKRHGLKPIVVPRIRDRGECVDDHQVAFARSMAERGSVQLAETEVELHRALDGAVEGTLDLRLAADVDGNATAVHRFEEMLDGLLGARTAAGAKPTRILFVGGCGRSGSTLLDRILGQVPGLWSVGEIVHIWRRGVGDNQLCGCGVPFRECSFWARVGEEAFGGWDAFDNDEMLRLQASVDRHRYVPLMIAPWLSRRYRRDLERYAGSLGRLYAAIRTVSGAEMIVDSTKHASYAFLLRHVPGVDLRIAHLVRDPRGVAYSWTKEVAKPEVTDHTELMPRYSPARMSGRWVVYNLLFHLLRFTGTRSVFLRYESLVRRPRRELERTLSLCEPSVTRELAFVDDGAVELAPTHTVAGNPMRFKQGRVTLRMDEQWRTAMPAAQRALVTALTWPLMRAYGYRARARA
jgi:UDP-N-acetylglucosamine transferase subunit ALG13